MKPVFRSIEFVCSLEVPPNHTDLFTFVLRVHYGLDGGANLERPLEQWGGRSVARKQRCLAVQWFLKAGSWANWTLSTPAG